MFSTLEAVQITNGSYPKDINCDQYIRGQAILIVCEGYADYIGGYQ